MGTLFVDKLDPQSGTALEIGSSGDTMTVPSGATFNVAGTLQSGGAAVANTPAFEAKLGSDMNVTDNAQTKVTCGTEVFDTDNAYDNSSNYRFTPQTAGKYYVYGAVGSITDTTHLKEARAMIWKNGSRYRTSTSDPRDNYGYHYNNYVAAVVDMNGSSDYVEVAFASENAPTISDTASAPSVFWGMLVHAT